MSLPVSPVGSLQGGPNLHLTPLVIDASPILGALPRPFSANFHIYLRWFLLLSLLSAILCAFFHYFLQPLLQDIACFCRLPLRRLAV